MTSTGVNSDFLTNYFGKGNDTGNLYKASDPGAALTYLGEDPAKYTSLYEKQTNTDDPDWSDLIELMRVLDTNSGDDLKAKLDGLMDIDSVLTALALDNLTVNLDSYAGMAQNYNLYRRPSDKRWVWIPWDPSLAFGALGQGLTLLQMKELPLEWVTTANNFPGAPAATATAAARPLASKLWAIPAYRARYREIYNQLATKVFVPDQVIARMNALRDLIRPWVVKDTQKLVTQEQFDQAMDTDLTLASGVQNPGGGNPPGGVPPTTPPGNPPPGIPPGGGLPGGGPGGASPTPGLQPFINARTASVQAQLATQ